MKILLDENIPAKVRFDLGSHHRTYTTRQLKWSGKKNGELLSLMSASNFDVFITIDKNIIHQQNLGKHKIKVFLLQANNNKHQTLQPLIEKLKKKLNSTRTKSAVLEIIR